MQSSFYTRFYSQLLHRCFCADVFAHRSIFHSEAAVTRRNLDREKPLHTQQHLRTRTQSFHTHTGFTQRNRYTEQLAHKAFTQRFFYHKEALAQRRFCAQKFFHRFAATQRSFYREKPLHRVTEQLLHTEPATRRSFYTHSEGFMCKCFYRRALLHRFFLREKPLHRAPFTHRKFYFREAFAHSSFDTLQNLRFFAHFLFVKGLPKDNSALYSSTRMISAEFCPCPKCPRCHTFGRPTRATLAGSRFDGRRGAAPATVGRKNRRVKISIVLWDFCGIGRS